MTKCKPTSSIVSLVVSDIEFETGIPSNLIMDGKNLDRRAVAARRQAIKVLSSYAAFSLKGIGDCFGISKVQVFRHLQKAQ